MRILVGFLHIFLLFTTKDKHIFPKAALVRTPHSKMQHSLIHCSSTKTVRSTADKVKRYFALSLRNSHYILLPFVPGIPVILCQFCNFFPGFDTLGRSHRTFTQENVINHLTGTNIFSSAFSNIWSNTIRAPCRIPQRINVQLRRAIYRI